MSRKNSPILVSVMMMFEKSIVYIYVSEKVASFRKELQEEETLSKNIQSKKSNKKK